jgi:hypothetical protein
MIENDIHTIELKRFRKQFLSFLLSYAMIIGMAWLADYSNFLFRLSPLMAEKLKWTFILFTTVLYVILSNLQARKMRNLLKLADFEEKVDEYFSLQRQRFFANLITGSLNCVLYVLTSRGVFLLLSIFYLATIALFYPTPDSIRRDLQQRDIDFI